jgi:hypothetical protein
MRIRRRTLTLSVVPADAISVRPRIAAVVCCLPLALATAALAGSPRPPAPRVVQRGTSTLTLLLGARSGLELRYRSLPGGPWRLRVAHGARRITLAGLLPATRYAAQLRRCTRGACSPWSSQLTAQTAPAAVPAPTPVDNANVPSASGTGGCQIFPADNPWHEDISQLPVDPRSEQYVNSIGADQNLHPDFGSERDWGIPYTVVPATQPLVPIDFTAYGDQSDPGPYPVPFGAPIEGGEDHHVLVIQSGTCKLYELYSASTNPDGSWDAQSGAVFDLSSDALRPDGWTSADAAGLPILPGLVRYDEIQAGVIDHAIRFTATETQAGYIHPATHFASDSSDPSLPPMGLRLRLKASYDISGFPRTDQIILTAMKRYGLILADNGSSWFFQGAPDPRWNDDELDMLKQVPGSAFEAVQTGPVLHTG